MHEIGVAVIGLKIWTKYPLIIVALALLSAFVTGIVAYTVASRELRRAAEGELTALLEARKAALESYLNSIPEDLRFLAVTSQLREAMLDFNEGWHELGANPGATLRRLYVTENPHPAAQRDTLDHAGDGSTYSSYHEYHHPWFRDFLRQRGYGDIFLFDPRGNLLYTVVKDPAFATNLIAGPWNKTGLGQVFRAVHRNPTFGFQVFLDFDSYTPSLGVPAGFVAAPVFDDGGLLIGILALRISVERLNSVMQAAAGMGRTGETYLVGQELLMRSNARFSKESTILRTKIDTAAVRQALDGKTGVALTHNRRGESVLAAHAPVGFMGVHWAIIAEIAESEVLAPVHTMRDLMLIAVAIIALVVTVIGFLLARNLARPIVAMTEAMGRLARRDLSVDIPSANRRDEIGEMANALEVFKENALKQEQAEAALRESEERTRAIVENVIDAIISIDARGTILSANPPTEDLFGYPVADLIGHNVRMLAPEPYRSAHDGYLTNYMTTGEAKIIGIGREVMGLRRNGEAFPMDLAVSEVRHDGEERLFVGIVRDITERHRAKAESQAQRDELEKLNDQKDKFFSIIAHDLKGPFISLLGASDLIVNVADKVSPKELSELAGAVSRGGKRVFALLENLLEWSLLQMDKVAIDPTVEDLLPLVQKSVDLLKAGADDKGIRIVNNVPEIAVMVDRNMADTVIRNLLNNALKFTEKSGKITIGAKKDGAWVEVSVEDTGVGMAADKVATLFRLDEKTSTAGTAGETGTGLGLQLCKELVERQGGALRVVSTEGEGSTFTFTLPTPP